MQAAVVYRQSHKYSMTARVTNPLQTGTMYYPNDGSSIRRDCPLQYVAAL